MSVAKMCVTCGSTIPSGERTYNEMCKACAVREAKKVSASVEKPRSTSPTPNFDAAAQNVAKGVSAVIHEVNKESWSGWSLIKAGCWCNLASFLFCVITGVLFSIYKEPVIFWGGVFIAANLYFLSSILILAGTIRIAIFPLIMQAEKTNHLLSKLATK